MINFILCIVANIFRLYIIRQFMVLFYDVECEKEKTRKEALGYTVYFLYTVIPYLLFHQPVVNFITNFSGMLVLSFLYGQSVKKNIFVSSSIYIVNIVCDCMSVLLFVDFKAGSDMNEFLAVLTDFLFWICYFGIGKILKGKEKSETIHVPLILIPVGSVGIIVLLVSEAMELSHKIFVISIILLFINIWTFYIYGIISGFYKERYEGILLKKEVEAYQKQSEMIKETEQRISHARHDLRHHVCELKILAGNKKYQELIAYLENMEEVTDQGANQILSGNPDIDSMLNYLLEKAENNLKVVHQKIKIPEGLKHSMDINIVLGNLLENAIESAEKTREQFMDIKVIYRQGILKIAISNSCKNSWQYGHGGVKTTKKDEKNHGIGLESVKKTVEKYQGAMEVTSENDIFQVKIIMYI